MQEVEGFEGLVDLGFCGGFCLFFNVKELLLGPLLHSKNQVGSILFCFKYAVKIV